MWLREILFRSVNLLIFHWNIPNLPVIKILKPVLFVLYDMVRPHGVVKRQIQGIPMFINADDRGVAPLLLAKGIMEPAETFLFQSLVKKDMVVVDVGANIGYYSLLAARVLQNSGVIYAFEPESRTFEVLKKNIELNGHNNIVLENRLVLDKAGKNTFWVDERGMAISSVSRDNVLAWGHIGKSKTPVSRDVSSITLDGYFSGKPGNGKVDLIKIDTQGAEGKVILGAEKTIRDHDVRILMEFWPYGLRNFGTDPVGLIQRLHESGFSFKSITEKGLKEMTPRALQVYCDGCRRNEELNLFLEKAQRK